MELSGFECIVLGAGIGGLSAATALAQRGAHVRVFEQAPKLREVGAGLQISPNGRVVLHALGLQSALDAAASQGTGVQLNDFKGARVLRLDLSRGRYGGFQFVHRADLLDLLLQGAREAGVDICLDHKVTSVSPGAPPVVHLLNGAAHRAHLVIGADGLHSVARAALNGTAAPFFTRQVAWRATIPETHNDPTVNVWMGPHRHLVSYTLRSGQLRNIVAVQERAEWVTESWSHQDDPANLSSAFSDFAPRVRALLEQVNDVHLWGLFRHPVARIWQRDGVALLGDAAHPTLPFLAQGANMALEDAWALAACLDHAPDLGTGLGSYQKARADRAARIVLAASKNARKYHLSFSPVRWAAHAALRIGGAVAPRAMLSQFDWLYGYDVTQDLNV